MDNLDVVRGPRISNAKGISGGRISVDPASLNGEGHNYPVVVYRDRVYLMSGSSGTGGRLHYRDITPDKRELDAIDELAISSLGLNGCKKTRKHRYA